ncbi:MAG: tRNA pseudouridine(55) synthase TruB [Gammaproteobacteria bacterium RIFCSPHIGHO2_12_FULL_35_23]|nr:MAG: tRNA pseudouridine(55) synthase TruB [Gammaproteobacteria bacterium RIFCSPHIGHO2_12_FULL_35_23]
MNKVQREKINGVLLLDKPVGISSSKACLIAKKLFHADKAGHTGSLDVLASGLLPICFGEATKFSQVLLEADKCYYTIAKLGAKTTTGDAEGEIIATGDCSTLNLSLIQKVLAKFLGETEQTPSMYSALKYHGQPLYKLARQGIEVARAARKIIIYEITVSRFHQDELELLVHCSKGTYIRNLIEDIGEVLGCFAYVKFLKRIKTGSFSLEYASKIESLNARAESEGYQVLQQLLLPVDSLLQSYPVLSLTREEAQRIEFGQKITVSQGFRGLVRLYSPERFLGLGEMDENQCLRAKRLVKYY